MLWKKALSENVCVWGEGGHEILLSAGKAREWGVGRRIVLAGDSKSLAGAAMVWSTQPCC